MNAIQLPTTASKILARFLLPCYLACATATAQQAGDSPVIIFIVIGQSNMPVG